jgi:type II secretory ATPase GspE/PulE/Tfp pilus assembly ATPase PilB-like protein
VDKRLASLSVRGWSFEFWREVASKKDVAAETKVDSIRYLVINRADQEWVELVSPEKPAVHWKLTFCHILDDIDILTDSDLAFVRLGDKFTVLVRGVHGCRAIQKGLAWEEYRDLGQGLLMISGLSSREPWKPVDANLKFAVFFSDGTYSDFSVRLGVMPSYDLPAVHIRILPNTPSRFDLDAIIPVETINNKLIRFFTDRRDGLLVISGPMGSGKTTTAYALLTALSQHALRGRGRPFFIATLEDPVETPLDYLLQITLRRELDFGVSHGLRAILRQNPDIVFFGEIRDREAAQAAVNAALTGHFVVTTLHCSSAKSAIERLHSLDISTRRLAGIPLLVLNQELVPCLCAEPGCTKPTGVCNGTALAALEWWKMTFPIIKSPKERVQNLDCPHCQGKEKHRIAVCNVIHSERNNEVQRWLRKGAPQDDTVFPVELGNYTHLDYARELFARGLVGGQVLTRFEEPSF